MAIREDERMSIEVKRKDLEKWSEKIYEAINEQEFVMDEFEEIMIEIGEYLESPKITPESIKHDGIITRVKKCQ